MTPTEIVELARVHFGERDALTISAPEAITFVNAAIKEIYEDLPVDRLKELLDTETVSLTGGKGDVPSNLDRIVEVYVDDNPAVAVPREVITTADYGSLFEPAFPVVHVDSSHVWVRPSDIDEVDLEYLQAPTLIDSGNTGDELTEIPISFHGALAFLVASYMYAQEEDVQQAQWYKNEYMANITSMSSQVQGDGE